MITALAPLHSRSERVNVERAVVALLDGLHRQRGGYLEDVGHYTGEFGSSDIDVVKNRLLGRAPVVLVSTGDAELDTKSTTRRRAVSILDLHIDVISAHLRSRETRHLGDEAGAVGTSDPGAYAMLADVRDRVMGADLGVPSAGNPILVSEEALLLEDEVAVFRMTFRVRCGIEANPPALVPPVAVEVVEHRHNLDSSAEVNPVVIGEATADG